MQDCLISNGIHLGGTCLDNDLAMSVHCPPYHDTFSLLNLWNYIFGEELFVGNLLPATNLSTRSNSEDLFIRNYDICQLSALQRQNLRANSRLIFMCLFVNSGLFTALWLTNP
eukprot:EG_transcript_32380